MGLADQLGYHHEEPNAVRRMMRSIAATGAGAWLGSQMLHHVDRFTTRLTQGRTSASEVLGGLPVIDVTTIGAKTGRPRTSPLLGIPFDVDLALIGSGWGKAPTPGWVYNLHANPEADVRYGNQTVAVRARLADEDERTRIWANAARVHPGYAKYQQRASHRDISIFALEAT